MKGTMLLVFRIDNWATKWNELQKETHDLMWNRIRTIVNGDSDLFELDEDGKHMVRKLHDDHDEDRIRWPTPPEWEAANIDRVTSSVTQVSDDADMIEHVAMTASTQQRSLTFAVLGLTTPEQKRSSCDDLFWNCSDLCYKLRRAYDRDNDMEVCKYFDFADDSHLLCMT